MKNLEKLKSDFENLRDSLLGREVLSKKTATKKDYFERYLNDLYKFSKVEKNVYPSQGLLTTPYDYQNYQTLTLLPQEKILKTLRLRFFFLSLFNHPYRIHFLKSASEKKFAPPPKVECPAIINAQKTGLSLAIGDLGASVVGSEKPRVSRTDRYAQGPFAKLGKFARSIFVGSSSPDVWNSSLAVATMACSNCLAGIPRNGVLSDITRQADLAKEIFTIIKDLETTLLGNRDDKNFISKLWRSNVMGTLEASVAKALPRAEALFKAGIRTFRVYSPEPGTGPVETTKALRKIYKNKIEIFTSFIVDINQAKRAEDAGANGIFVGVGGGGRCITGVRSGSAIDWPSLVFNLRGDINIPVIVEGGASDHIAVTLLLGASGVSVSRIAAGGSIESPGGALYALDERGKLFKPYGGEASARTKYLERKLLPFDIPSFVEGETAKAYISYVKHALPTLTYNLHLLNEDAILAMVFRNVDSIGELHKINPSPLKRVTSFDQFQRNTH
jgi:hypothetical protein